MDLFVVRKYIIAKDIQDAIKKDKKILPQDIWIDEGWKKEKIEKKNKKIKGF